MCVKVSITRHAWVLAWLCCLCLDVYMLCLGMTVYAVLCVTVSVNTRVGSRPHDHL